MNSSYFFLPSWLLPKIEKALSLALDESAADQALASYQNWQRMASQSPEHVLSFFQSCQNQVLSGQDVVTFTVPCDAERRRSINGAEFLDALVSMRCDFMQGPSKHFAPVFQTETCKIQSSQDTSQFVGRFSRFGKELMTGYYDPYGELIRIRPDRGEAPFLNGVLTRPSLAIRTSVWSDLNSIEKLLYLRIEQARQLDNDWLHLDGGMGCPLSGMLEGISVESDHFDKFVTFLRLAKRLGDKLVEHGVLSNYEKSYVALPQTARCNPMLFWQHQRTELNTSAHAGYSSLLIDMFEKQYKIADLHRFAIVCKGGPITEADFDFTVKVFEFLRSKIPAQAVGLSNSPRLVSSSLLFLELWLRVHIGDQNHPFNKLLKKNGLIWGIFNKSEQRCSLALSNYLSALQEDEFLNSVTDCSGISFTSEVTQNSSEFISYLNQIGSYLYGRGLTFASSSPSSDHVLREAPKVPGTPKVDGVAGVASQSTSALSGSSGHRDGEASEAVGVGQKLPNLSLGGSSKIDLMPLRESKVAGGFLAKMRLAAAEELEKIQKHDPEQYQVLKEQYIAQLDQASQNMLRDIQKHMSHKAFEQNLKHKLIRFMAENPNSWKSTSRRPRRRVGGHSKSDSSFNPINKG